VERTKAFGELVRSAPELIPLLPWSSEFEKDKFLSPDFTSLEVLTFCGMYGLVWGRGIVCVGMLDLTVV